MRYLIETHPSESLELIDGVKVKQPHSDDWILILPDASEPLVHLYANGSDRNWVEAILSEYQQRVQDFIALAPDSDRVPEMAS